MSCAARPANLPVKGATVYVHFKSCMIGRLAATLHARGSGPLYFQPQATIATALIFYQRYFTRVRVKCLRF